jgi:hypothetical protein
MIQCKKCQNEKPESEMKLRAGKPSKVCLACDEAAATERERIRKTVADAKAEMRSSKKRGGGKPRKKVLPLRGNLVQRRTSSSSRFTPAASV